MELRYVFFFLFDISLKNIFLYFLSSYQNKKENCVFFFCFTYVFAFLHLFLKVLWVTGHFQLSSWFCTSTNNSWIIWTKWGIVIGSLYNEVVVADRLLQSLLRLFGRNSLKQKILVEESETGVDMRWFNSFLFPCYCSATSFLILEYWGVGVCLKYRKFCP